jgi:UDP-N-acetylglucosamine--N-acetylmuramyl-(pentapeptide) pyrophosphoryl-undecaprenol N-acetylglucosamine transferase
VYPALSILQAIGNRASEVLWVGGEGGMEAELIASRSIPFKAVPAAGVHGVGFSKLPGNLWKLAKGVAASRKILREFAPDVLLFTGGFVAVPMALAGIAKNSLLYVPDIEPGLALRTLARFSDLIALTAGDSKEYFAPGKKTAITGYPTRADFVKMDKAEARKKLGLKQDQPVLLVIGGSKGAHLINAAVLPNLASLLQEFQVVHVSGTTDFQECQQFQAAMAPQLKANYHLFAYLHDEVSMAFSAADLAISRAGASILGELPLMGLPAVLVPYPFAWRYQKVNADYLVQHGAAIVINNSDLQAQLQPTIKALFSDRTKLTAMSQAMSELATPQAAAKLADLVCQLAAKAQGGKHD